MPNSKRLSSLVESAYKNNDISSAIHAYNEWQSSQCYHPIKTRVYDAHTQTYRFIDVACGKCYHCLETKINEWVTRMYAHLEDFKHVYFITLTYRSFYSIREPERLMLQKLSQACFHYDNKNFNNRYSWNPCVLVKKHYQDFFKRLRKNTGITDLSYVISGEYGKNYGRPHFHAILFSNSEIFYNDIRKAWSVALWRYNDGSFSLKTNQKHNGCSYDFPIGKVDYNDLVSNGSLNTSSKVRVDGSYLSANRCFAYVCKYVCKRDDANLNRVYLAFNSLYEKRSFVNVYDKEFAYTNAVEYCKSIGMPLQNINHLKQLSYEKVVRKNCKQLFTDYLVFTQTKSLFGHSFDVELFPKNLTDFKSQYSPFVEFSRGCAIGSLYAIRHLQEFVQGVYTKPILQTSSYVRPSYFVSKAKNYLYPIKELRSTFKSKSCSLGRLRDFYEILGSGRSVSSSLIRYVPYWSNSQDISSYVKDGRYCYKDVHKGERIILFRESALYYKYDRSKRKYIESSSIPINLFIANWLESLRQELARYHSHLADVQFNDKCKESALLSLEDMGVITINLHKSFCDRQLQYLHEKQQLYDFTHHHCE